MMIAGLVLVGGKSSRMGLPKATLPFGSETMLARVLRLLGTVARPIVVVAAPGQKLPNLPDDVLVTHDEHEGRGPLEGLAAGLAALAGQADAVYATSCDVPLLVPVVVELLARRLGSAQIAVVVEGEFAHPLAAIYRPDVLPVIRDLLSQDRLRPSFLFERVATVRVPAEELRTVDPQLTTLQNLNRPEDYLAALAQAGLTPHPRLLAQLDKPGT